MATDISKIDKNLQVTTETELPGCVYRDVRKEPFCIHGLYQAAEGPGFRRLPREVAEKTNTGVARLFEHTAGGRVRFCTDSEYVAIRCTMPYITHYSHMPLTGIAGFDMYVARNGKDVFTKTFVPPYAMTDGYSSVHHFQSKQMREITINFPLYNPVGDLYIGLEESASLKTPSLRN